MSGTIAKISKTSEFAGLDKFVVSTDKITIDFKTGTVYQTYRDCYEENGTVKFETNGVQSKILSGQMSALI